MAKDKNEKPVELDQSKTDTTNIQTKPELKVRFQGPNKPGSFVVRDGTFEPNLNDNAMRERAERKNNTE